MVPMWLLKVLITTGLIALTLTGLSQAKIIVVDDEDGPWAKYSLIQSAIDDADPGDEIRIYDGVYNESVRLSKRLTITGNGTEKTVIISAGKNGLKVTVSACNISGITIRGGDRALWILSDSNEIDDVTVTGADHAGIEIDGNYNLLDGVTSTGNEGYGIYIQGKETSLIHCTVSENGNHGVYLLTAESSILYRCLIYNNSGFGVRLSSTNRSEITYSYLFMNEMGAILITNMSRNNEIHHNALVSVSVSTATDRIGENQWDDGEEGNYWSDYTGTDGNDDGVGDQPHRIPGGTNATDRAPLMEPVHLKGMRLPPIVAIRPVSFVEVYTPFTFSALIIDLDGNVTSIMWEFGDGHNSTESRPLHLYTQTGKYTVTLRVTDDDGLTSRAVLDISVYLVVLECTDDVNDVVDLKGDPVSGHDEIDLVYAGFYEYANSYLLTLRVSGRIQNQTSYGSICSYGFTFVWQGSQVKVTFREWGAKIITQSSQIPITYVIEGDSITFVCPKTDLPPLKEAEWTAWAKVKGRLPFDNLEDTLRPSEKGPAGEGFSSTSILLYLAAPIIILVIAILVVRTVKIRRQGREIAAPSLLQRTSERKPEHIKPKKEPEKKMVEFSPEIKRAKAEIPLKQKKLRTYYGVSGVKLAMKEIPLQEEETTEIAHKYKKKVVFGEEDFEMEEGDDEAEEDKTEDAGEREKSVEDDFDFDLEEW